MSSFLITHDMMQYSTKRCPLCGKDNNDLGGSKRFVCIDSKCDLSYDSQERDHIWVDRDIKASMYILLSCLRIDGCVEGKLDVPVKLLPAGARARELYLICDLLISVFELLYVLVFFNFCSVLLFVCYAHVQLQVLVCP